MKETLPEFDNMRIFETRKPLKSFFNLEMKRTSEVPEGYNCYSSKTTED